MKRQISLIMIVCLAIAQSCSLDEPTFGPETPGAEPYKVQISGDIDQQPATKVTTDGFCTGDEVGVYIVNYDGETPGKLKLEKNQADNVRFKYDGAGSWVSDYDIFYKDNDTKVDFYGYYPYSESLSSSSAAQTTSVEAYAFEVERDQSKGAEDGKLSPYEASDFLWAKTEKVTPTSSKVMMRFRHKMSSARVRFSMGAGWADESEFAAVSKEVLVTNTVRKTVIDLSTGVVTPIGEAPLTGIIPMNDNGEFRAIVAPQTVEAGKNVLVITIGGGAPRYFAGEKGKATEYVPGKITTFELKVSKVKETGEYEIELAGVSITAWEADNVSHGDDAREYVVIHNAIAGRLEETVVKRLEMDPTAIKNLKLTGSINGTDYAFMNQKMASLQRLNLKEVESLIGGVYAIPANAFYGKKTLVKCFLPDKLERIEDNAFANTALTGSLILPEGLKYVSGFEKTNITSVSFPSTLEEIGDYAFKNCSKLMSAVSFPESLKKIGSQAFLLAAISGTLSLPNNLESIGKHAFCDCTDLSGSLVIPNRITSISGSAFRSCGFTGTLTLPNGLTTIEESAFAAVAFKGELHIPETVTIIENEAFSSTKFNGTLALPKELLYLGESAFSGCWRLSGIVAIPQNIIAIPPNLFYRCTGLEGVVLHKDVETIAASAFQECFGITSIVSEAKNPPTISSDSFNGVAKDNFTVEVPEASVAQYRNASNWSEFKRFAAHHEFSISRSLLRTLNAEHSKTYVLRAPAGENWSVESKPDWVEVSPASGTGKTDVTVTVNTLAEGSTNRSGEVVFLLEGKDYRSKMTVEQYDYQYGDGEVITFQKASKGKGVNIVLMGDCFDAKDISEGKYLQAMQDAYKYFFDIEPYLTYKDYFNVYGVFGVSPDSGMGTVNTIRESRFGSQYTLNEGVSPDSETTFTAACLAPIDNNVAESLVIMVENSADYSGVTYMWGDGSAIAVVPMSTDPAPYDFRGILHHEAGGHGFGKLQDEYIYHNAFIQSCSCLCCDHVEEFNLMKSYGFGDNVSLTGSMNDVPWSHLIYDPQYSNTVDVYEGAFFHSRGVFRSEPTSCMHNNIPYYNAISREAIVKRIMKYACEEYSFENFKANDKEALPRSATKAAEQQENRFELFSGKSASGYNQMPPKFMGEKPSFKKNREF
ncbi:MAG: leucine-rich repeat protein [Bacteroidales bacterium]|nr:leucine-rich repeat protein [Bacteroidales bacterium]